MLICILKAFLGKLPQYISSLLTYCTSIYNTRTTDKCLLKMPNVIQKQVDLFFFFFNYAPYAWNELQGILHMKSVPPLAFLKNILKSVFMKQCKCFNS